MVFRRLKEFSNYFVDKEGNVYSIKSRRKLKPRIHSRYLSIGLSKNGVVKEMLVHRLIAMAFIPNPKGLPQVNHKDENKLNNRVENLEWCTASYNLKYSSYKRSGNNHWNSKPKEYYSKHYIRTDHFRLICKRRGWDFNSFKKIYSGKKYNRSKLYYFIKYIRDELDLEL